MGEIKEKKADVVTADDNKWGKFGGGCLVGESFVNLFIPKDKLNPSNHFWIGLNGDEAYLATGKQIRVPQSIADNYNYSYNATMLAEEKMNEQVEIN